MKNVLLAIGLLIPLSYCAAEPKADPVALAKAKASQQVDKVFTPAYLKKVENKAKVLYQVPPDGTRVHAVVNGRAVSGTIRYGVGSIRIGDYDILERDVPQFSKTMMTQLRRKYIRKYFHEAKKKSFAHYAKLHYKELMAEVEKAAAKARKEELEKAAARAKQEELETAAAKARKEELEKAAAKARKEELEKAAAKARTELPPKSAVVAKTPAKRPVSIPHSKKCVFCYGGKVRCYKCGDSINSDGGMLAGTDAGGTGCKICDFTGKLPCKTCLGTGITPAKRTVPIPRSKRCVSCYGGRVRCYKCGDSINSAGGMLAGTDAGGTGCKVCDFTGKLPCKTCLGTGITPSN